MNNRVRTVFNRRKQASDTTCAAVEIVVCLGRERFYFSIGIFLNATQWLDGKVINHPKEVLQVMMGHSSIRTTELYAKLPIEFVTRNLDKKLFHVWG